jgi:DNA-binding response OmpR family regulator
MGADDFIRKPFSERLLVERVKAVLWPPGLHILNSRQNLSASWSAASSRPLVASCPKTWIAGSRTSERHIASLINPSEVRKQMRADYLIRLV